MNAAEGAEHAILNAAEGAEHVIMTHQGIRFLVVDDDLESRTQISTLLESIGYGPVTEAPSIARAIEVLNADGTDFVICDWNTGGGAGLGLLKLVKQQDRYKDLSFLMISVPQANEENKIKKAGEASVDAYILKPFTASTLKSTIDQIRTRQRQ